MDFWPAIAMSSFDPKVSGVYLAVEWVVVQVKVGVNLQPRQATAIALLIYSFVLGVIIHAGSDVLVIRNENFTNGECVAVRVAIVKQNLVRVWFCCFRRLVGTANKSAHFMRC